MLELEDYHMFGLFQLLGVGSMLVLVGYKLLVGYQSSLLPVKQETQCRFESS